MDYTIHMPISCASTEIFSAISSYRSSIVKFPDFSSHGMTISPTLSKQ